MEGLGLGSGWSESEFAKKRDRKGVVGAEIVYMYMDVDVDVEEGEECGAADIAAAAAAHTAELGMCCRDGKETGVAGSQFCRTVEADLHSRFPE